MGVKNRKTVDLSGLDIGSLWAGTRKSHERRKARNKHTRGARFGDAPFHGQ